jgi:hypothetical protein
MKSLAVGRAVAHKYPPAAVPQITGADTQSELSVALGASFHCFSFSAPSPIGHLLRSGIQSRSRNMVSSEAKNGFNCVSCGTFRAGARQGRAPFAKTRTPPRVSRVGVPRAGLGNPHGGSSEVLLDDVLLRAPQRKYTGAPKVPHRTSCPLLLGATRRRRLSSITRAPCRSVMGVPGQLAGGAVGSECNW